MSDQDQEKIIVSEEQPDHHFRTEIPNIIFEYLSGDALIVYIILKRICGDQGKCWMTMKNLSKKCHIGLTTLHREINNLSCDNGYAEKAFIKVQRRKRPDGTFDTNIITINPIWRENGDFFRNQKKIDPSPREGGTSPREGGTSPREVKEDPSQEEPSQEKQQQHEEEDVVVVPLEIENALKKIPGLNHTIRKFALAYTLEQILCAIECCQNADCENINGFFRTALQEGWIPKTPKDVVDDQKEEETSTQKHDEIKNKMVHILQNSHNNMKTGYAIQIIDGKINAIRPDCKNHIINITEEDLCWLNIFFDKYRKTDKV